MQGQVWEKLAGAEISPHQSPQLTSQGAGSLDGPAEQFPYLGSRGLSSGHKTIYPSSIPRDL